MNLPGQAQTLSDRKVRAVIPCKSSNAPVEEAKEHLYLGRGALLLPLAHIQTEGLAVAVPLGHASPLPTYCVDNLTADLSIQGSASPDKQQMRGLAFSAANFSLLSQISALRSLSVAL